MFKNSNEWYFWSMQTLKNCRPLAKRSFFHPYLHCAFIFTGKTQHFWKILPSIFIQRTCTISYHPRAKRNDTFLYTNTAEKPFSVLLRFIFVWRNVKGRVGLLAQHSIRRFEGNPILATRITKAFNFFFQQEYVNDSRFCESFF